MRDTTTNAGIVAKKSFYKLLIFYKDKDDNAPSILNFTKEEVKYGFASYACSIC